MPVMEDPHCPTRAQATDAFRQLTAERLTEIRAAATSSSPCLRRGGRSFVCGNGGSARMPSTTPPTVGRFLPSAGAQLLGAEHQHHNLTAIGPDYAFEPYFLPAGPCPTTSPPATCFGPSAPAATARMSPRPSAWPAKWAWWCSRSPAQRGQARREIDVCFKAPPAPATPTTTAPARYHAESDVIERQANELARRA